MFAHTERPANPLDKTGLAGAQLAVERNRVAGPQPAGKFSAQPGGFLFRM
jgi:hypothetical protein